MNDEIKEILSNDNIHIIECDKNWCNAYGYEKSQLKEDLLDYLTNLEQKVEQYENPDDMTLFYMWLDTKAKDKIKQLQEENERLKEKENKLQEKFKDWKKRIEKERKHYLCDRTDCCGRIKDSKKYRSLYQENERLNNIIDDKKERQEIAIRLLHKLFGTDDYEINYIIGIINGQRQIKFDEELKEGKNGRL